jgi:hypothetical protein
MMQLSESAVSRRKAAWQASKDDGPPITDSLPIFEGELPEVMAVIRAGLEARPETPEDCAGFLRRWCEAKERFRQAKGL